ncbi:MAG TPA: hypothetical protein VFX51_00675 [Solirubrobacteraceae bacterium]|nr:hypothetical protein [Solirubrobacteraceae bacterium]
MGRLVVVIAALLVAAGCGESKPPVAVVSEKEHHADVARNPYALTCRDLARQPLNSVNQRLVIDAEFALAKDPALRSRVADMTENRVGRSVYWALTELCKGRPGAYEPARAAVAAVHDGKYLVQPRPESWSHPELWSDPAIEKLGD